MPRSQVPISVSYRRQWLEPLDDFVAPQAFVAVGGASLNPDLAVVDFTNPTLPANDELGNAVTIEVYWLGDQKEAKAVTESLDSRLPSRVSPNPIENLRRHGTASARLGLSERVCRKI
jgi:hypothetical protein